MESNKETVDCQSYSKTTKRVEPFNIIVCKFNYKSNANDKILLDSLIKKGLILADKVNPGAANNSFKKREFEKIKNNCVAGVIAEYCWQEYLNDNGLVLRVAETPFSDASNQIDLRIFKGNKSIEVRSSFPRNGIPFALCHPEKEFDVIGPYANDYKPGEIKKDFYVRTLFHLQRIGEFKGSNNIMYPLIEKIIDKVYQDGFEVFLTGGADWAMMANDKIAMNKDFIPEDELSVDRIRTASKYRVVPFSNALDTIEIYEIIKAL